MKYRKKPVVIEAMQLTKENWKEACEFITLPWGPKGVHGVYHKEGVEIDDDCELYNEEGNLEEANRMALVIPTLEDDHLALKDDYIIKDNKGEFHPCKPDIFKATYDKVEGE